MTPKETHPGGARPKVSAKDNEEVVARVAVSEVQKVEDVQTVVKQNSDKATVVLGRLTGRAFIYKWFSIAPNI